MANTLRSRVLCGDIRDLPLMNSQAVRIFTSSTFTDTMEERNSLIENVYPKIQQYCRSKYGLEFQVVDMRWGVRDEATDDHQTATLCIKEIQNCQRLSAGPNFVAFLGQRAGHRPFPASIESTEFAALLEELESSSVEPTILKQWFTEDNNASPPVYVLQPISSRIPGYLSDDEVEKKAARREWNAAFGKMQLLLRQAAKACHAKGTITKETREKYFMSVTENEIQKGIFDSPGDPNTQCLCFIRIIEDVLSNLSHEKAWRFIDMVGSKVDEDAQKQLAHLRDERLTKEITNLYRLKVLWKDVIGGLTIDKRNYLNSFSDTFYKALVQMIDKGITYNQELADDTLYLEVLQHAHMAKNHSEAFHGRKDVLDELKEHLEKRASDSVIVTGSSGCGKTSVIAKCAILIPKWRNDCEPVVLLRLLGTTLASTGVQLLMRSLCQQIIRCYAIVDIELPEDFTSLIREFSKLLENATAEKPIYIVLDSLDQLSEKENAFRLTWLPKVLPQNVTLLVSTLPDQSNLLETLKKRYDSGSFVNVPSLGGDTSREILNSMLESDSRKLTNDQLEIVNKAFDECSLALYVKIMADRVLTWTSYFDTSSIQLPMTIRASINQLFDELKPKLGATFITHTLGYLTASRRGLSETEMEDLLSLDDVVLTDVFQYHVPPVRRIPQLLWLRLKSEISPYLVYREADGTRVIFWYHRQFIEAASAYFLNDTKHSTYLHQKMFEYFSGIWHNKEKNFTYNEIQINKLGLSSPESKADRKVSPQPLLFEKVDNDATTPSRVANQFNLRRLLNVPYHIRYSGSAAECDALLRTECLYNYKWLQTKVRACSAQAVLNDFDLLHYPDECDDWLCDVFRMRKTSLNQNPSTLPVEISGTLLPVASVQPHLKKLIDDCYSSGVVENALLPRILCYNMPGGSLIHELEHPLIPGTKKQLVLTKNPIVLAGLSQTTNTLIVWDIEGGDVIEEVKLWPELMPKFNVIATSITGDKIITGCAYHDTVNPIAIYDVAAEAIIVSVELDKTYPKIGFIDSYQIGLTDNKIFVNVKGREADCFDLHGKLLYSFDLQAIDMQLFHEPNSHKTEVVFVLKDDVDVMWYDASQINKTSGSTITMAQVPHKVAIHDDGNNVFVLYKGEPRVIWFQRIQVSDKVEEWNLKNTIELHDDFTFFTFGIPTDISVTGRYVMLFSPEGISLWKYAKKRLYNEFRIPERLIPKEEKISSFTAKVTTDRRLLLCAYDNYIIIWNLTHGMLLQTLRASTKPVSELLIGNCSGKLFPSDILVTATSHYRSIKVWDVSKVDLQTYQPLIMGSACRYVHMAETANRMIVRSHDVFEIRIVDVASGKFISQPVEELESTTPLISPDGKYGVIKDFQTAPIIRVFNTDSGEIVTRIPVETIYLKRYTISKNSSYIATHAEVSPTEGVETMVWNIQTGKLIQKIKAAQGGICKILFVNNDKLLVTLQMYPFIQKGENGVIHVYSVKSGKEIVTVANILRNTSLIAIPNSSYLYTYMADGSDDRTKRVAIIDARDGKEIMTYQKEAHSLWAFTVSLDGKTAVDSELHVTDIFSGQVLCDLSSQVPENEELEAQLVPQVTPDGRFVVWLVVTQAIVKVARISDNKVIGICCTHGQPVSLAISKDNIVAVCTYEGIILLLSIIDSSDPDAHLQVQTLKDFIASSASQTAWTAQNNLKISDRAQSCTCDIL